MRNGCVEEIQLSMYNDIRKFRKRGMICMTKRTSNRTYIDGEILSALRKSKGLSQEALADKANLSKRSVEDYERRKCAGLRPDSAKRLAEALDVDLSKLLTSRADVIESGLPTIPAATDIDNTNIQNCTRPQKILCNRQSMTV